LKKNKILNVIKAVWAVAVVAGGIYYVIKNYTTAINYLHNISTFKLILSLAFIVVVRVLNIDLVQQSLVLVGWKANFKKAFSFVSISQLGKYIPGGIWQYVARFQAYKEADITYKNMGKAFVVENIWVVVGSFLVSLAFIFFSRPVALLQKYGIQLTNQIMILLGIVCLLLWLTVLAVIEQVMKAKSQSFSTKRLVLQFISQTLLWILLGVSFFCLFSKTSSLNDLFFTIGAFGLSYLAGYVVIIAPGGIGVREYVAILLFSGMFSSAEIGIYAIVHRLLYTIGDFGLAGISLLFSRKKTNTISAPLEEK
jgi:uncharacterized membrane protein YbhN (UPF0104 family)